MTTMTFKCPCCGAPLAFDGQSRQLSCSACGNQFDTDALSALQQADSGSERNESFEWDMQRKVYEDAQVYVCQSCGAELMTDPTTTATECAYCGSPIVLADQLSGVQPEFVLPFKVSEEQAKKMFHDYFKGKRLIPNVFEQTRNRISEIRRLYVPFWLFTCRANAEFTYNATHVTVTRRGDMEETVTKHYLVRRAGSLDFSGIPVDGSEKLDNKITESLEPYDFSESIPFAPATLAGSLADRADVSEEECRSRANDRLRASTEDTFRDTVNGYHSVTTRSSSIQLENGKAVSALLPVWLIRTRKNVKGAEKTYTFAINGQTGELTCDVPMSITKALKWFFGLTAAITAAGFGLMLLLAQTGVIGGGLK